jgi:hypothetical protein
MMCPLFPYLIIMTLHILDNINLNQTLSNTDRVESSCRIILLDLATQKNIPSFYDGIFSHNIVKEHDS